VRQQGDDSFDERPADIGAVAGDSGEALRAAERRYGREFGRAPYGMIIASLNGDRPGACLAVNDAFCELTGCSRRECGGRDFLGVFHPEEQPALETLIQNVICGANDQLRLEARLVRKDGEIVFVRLTGSAIQPSAGERYLAVYVENAAAVEQARAEIRQLELELHRSRRLESVGQLVGGIAHDFNNLLTVISNYASIVRDEVSVAEATESATRWEPVRWDVEQIESAADRAKRLIRHLLAFARRDQTHPQLVDLGQLVHDMIRFLGEVLGEHVPVVTRHGAGLRLVEVDPGLLEQAVINIVMNARDAMPMGGQITIQTANIDTASPDTASSTIHRQDAADIAELLPGCYVALRITDTGSGMDKAIADRAFEPFFTTKAGDQAAGLGLSAVRMFAARAGGRTWLRSEPGAGTTVTVVLPAADGSGSGTAGQAADCQGALAEHPRTVLAIDDEAAIRDVAHRVLTNAGYQVATAPNGQEGLDLLRDPGMPADLVLTDVVMPGITGQALADQIQVVRPGIQVLFMSGYERPDAVGDSWPDPGTEVISKPFSRAALLAKVSQMLATASARTNAQ
jgi:PAS domain S-box-containing protein